MRAYRMLPIFLLGLTVSDCNLEVGNPDSDGESIGRRSALSSLNLSLSPYEVCPGSSSRCASLPVRLADGTDGITFEMSEARMLLQRITLEPYAQQLVTTEVDLFSGAPVFLNQTVDASAVITATLQFGSEKVMNAATYFISGDLVVSNGVSRHKVPVSLSYGETITAQSPMEPGAVSLSGLAFDASTWFDFSATQGNLAQLFINLASGACKDSASRSCQQYSTVLSQLVAQRIANSLRVQKQASNNGISGKQLR
ncbi:MAG: hypothetical protein ACOY5B_18715 [Spirochaetota bacterium]